MNTDPRTKHKAPRRKAAPATLANTKPAPVKLSQHPNAIAFYNPRSKYEWSEQGVLGRKNRPRTVLGWPISYSVP